MKNRLLYVLSVIIIYILILIPSLNTPMQSDDYFYYLKGISWESTVHHYMNWSGRLVTDFLSSLLLKYLPYYLYESINAFVFTLLCVFISLIPKFIKRNNINDYNVSSVILWLIFLTYWITNPQLGHTSFWIVGSANYLWTIMWASAYIILILYYTNIKNKIYSYDYLFLGILGFLAGCSNESTSVSIVLFTFIMFFIEQRKNVISVGFISSLIGASILILAPGNQVRMLNHQDWYSKSTIQQLKIHIFDRMPNALSQYLHIYLLIIVALIILILIQKKGNYKSFIYVGVFFFLSLFSNLVLVKSPYIMGRSLNTGLFFLLPILAIIVYEFQNSKGLLIKYPILIGYTLIFFIPSYIYFTYMMVQAKTQFQIRENIIITAKNNNNDSVIVPEWYFTKLLKGSDPFDTYQDSGISNYYEIKNVTNSRVNFNYAILNQKNNKYQINKLLKDNLKLLNIYNYTNDIISFNKNELVIEFNESVKKYIKEGDTILFIHIYDEKDQMINSDNSIDSEVEINNKFYFNAFLNNVKMADVSKIIIGFYNPESQKNSAEFEIPLN